MPAGPSPDGAAAPAPRIRRGSAWDGRGITAFLQSSRIPLRLACQTASGGPLVCSLWFTFDDGVLWCASGRRSRVIQLLARDGRCGFEVAGDLPPYRGVRGQGHATLVAAAGPAVLGRLIDRYLGDRESTLARWLLDRQDDEVAIGIRPDWLKAWDYSRRMAPPRELPAGPATAPGRPGHGGD